MKILITGITGFVGSHLAEYVQETFSDVDIYGTIRNRSKRENISHLKNINYVECDLADAHGVKIMIGDIRPDKIFHLAAQSDVATSFKMPEQTLDNNIQCELNILEAVRQIDDYNPVIHIAGTSEEYGLVLEEETPINEDNPLRPMSPYAVSKVAQENLALQYNYSYDMKCIVTRAFNHTGKRRGSNFAESSWAKAIMQGEIVKHGNLESCRDYTNVRDTVRAYWLLSENENAIGEVFNVCFGETHKMQEVLEMLCDLSGKQVSLIKDQSRMRPSDVPILLGSYYKLKELTGWEPEISFEETMQELLDYWK